MIIRTLNNYNNYEPAGQPAVTDKRPEEITFTAQCTTQVDARPLRLLRVQPHGDRRAVLPILRRVEDGGAPAALG